MLIDYVHNFIEYCAGHPGYFAGFWAIIYITATCLGAQWIKKHKKVHEIVDELITHIFM